MQVMIGGVVISLIVHVTGYMEVLSDNTGYWVYGGPL